MIHTVQLRVVSNWKCISIHIGPRSNIDRVFLKRSRLCEYNNNITKAVYIYTCKDSRSQSAKSSTLYMYIHVQGSSKSYSFEKLL